MVNRNPHIAKLRAGYLFPEIIKRKRLFQEKNPHAKLIGLGVGDTTEPLPTYIVEGLKKEAEDLGTRKGYRGYGPEQGDPRLREKIAHKLYQKQFSSDEVFISDGTNSDIARLQVLFGSHVSIAVQDPTYPVYVDVGVMMGQTSTFDFQQSHYKDIVYLPCEPENGFFPDLKNVPRTDLIFFCSPNNPTGAAATKEQLKELVAFAKKNRSIIIYDTAYSHFIRDVNIPKSIYEIEGAKEVAIEMGSFSKMAGFTGVRLAWSVVPKELMYENGQRVMDDWDRVHCTLFNGASHISQTGGLYALEPEGLEAIQALTDYYMQNASLLKSAFQSSGYPTYGGEHAPYVWVKFPQNSSWKAFEELMERTHLISIPGSGFGPAGEGFLRFSAFAQRHLIEEAVERIKGLSYFELEDRPLSKMITAQI